MPYHHSAWLCLHHHTKTSIYADTNAIARVTIILLHYINTGIKNDAKEFKSTVELQWLEHWWHIYHGCFELVLESLGKTHPMHICDNLGWFSFVILVNGILFVLIRIASMRRFKWEHTIYHHVKENLKDTLIMPPDLPLWLTLISSIYPCLELIFMVPKVFEPLKFYCIWVHLHVFLPFSSRGKTPVTSCLLPRLKRPCELVSTLKERICI